VRGSFRVFELSSFKRNSLHTIQHIYKPWVLKCGRHVGLVAEWGKAGGGGWAKLDCALEVLMRVLVFRLIAVEVRDARSS
jgi:hypothetical protein